MKTIEVTDEMHEALMKLSKDLNTQDHRSTRMPYMIQVSEKVEVAAYSGCGDTYWFNEDVKLYSEDEEQVIKDYLYEKYGVIHDYEKLDHYEKEEILEDLGYRKHEVTTIDKLSNFFFTNKGLRDYYGDDVNTFLTGVSNPELELVMKFLCELTGGKLHT